MRLREASSSRSRASAAAAASAASLAAFLAAASSRAFWLASSCSLRAFAICALTAPRSRPMTAALVATCLPMCESKPVPPCVKPTYPSGVRSHSEGGAFGSTTSVLTGTGRGIGLGRPPGPPAPRLLSYWTAAAERLPRTGIGSTDIASWSCEE